MPKEPSASEATVAGGGGGGAGRAFATHVYSRDPLQNGTLGLGMPAVSDAQSFAAGFGRATGASGGFTEQGLVHAGVPALGVKYEISAGAWTMDPAGLQIDAAAMTGDLIVAGQGQGGTQIQMPANVSPGYVITSSSRGDPTGVWPVAHGGNVFTLGFAGVPVNAYGGAIQPGDLIAFLAPNLGVLEWFHHIVMATSVGGDPTQIQFLAWGVGQATDACIPPVGSTCFWVWVGWNFLNFKNPNECYLRDLSFKALGNTHTPADGIPFRHASRMHVEQSVRITNGWKAAIITPAPLGATGANAQKLNNTDHSFFDATVTGCADGILMVDNSAASWSQTAFLRANAGPPIVQVLTGGGGGRDNHFDLADMGAPNRNGLGGSGYHFVANDGGVPETMDLSGANLKSGWGPFYWEGFEGVPTADQQGIDALQASNVKIESPSNDALGRDASHMRVIQALEAASIRQEAGLAINGSGNPSNFSYQPYHLTAVSIASPGGVLTMTATIAETVPLGIGWPVQFGIGAVGELVAGDFQGEGIVSAVGNAGAVTIVVNTKTNNLVPLVAGNAVQMGLIGGLRCGMIDRYELTWNPDIVGVDRFVGGVEWFDLDTLGTGRIKLLKSNQFAGALKTGMIPRVRSRDFETISASDGIIGAANFATYAATKLPDGVTGVTLANLFGSKSACFSQSMIGRSVATIGNVVPGTIAFVLDPFTVQMTAATVGASTALQFAVKPRVSIQTLSTLQRPVVMRGQSRYEPLPHDSADTNAIGAGMLVEMTYDTNGFPSVRRSTAVRGSELLGVAQNGHGAGGGFIAGVAAPISVTTNGLAGNSLRILTQTGYIWVALFGNVIYESDPAPLQSGGNAIAGGVQVIDAGGGIVAAAVLAAGIPVANQHIVGVSAGPAAGGVVPVRLLAAPYWT